MNYMGLKTRKDVSVVRKKYDLTERQFLMLSNIKSVVYHEIRFNGKPDNSSNPVDLGDLGLDDRKMRPIETLITKGYLAATKYNKIVVTEDGWKIPTNSNATLFLFGVDIDELVSTENVQNPITFYG